MGVRRCCAVFVGIACVAPGAAEARHLPNHVELGNDRQILPTLITIDPGDTVTWEWVGPDLGDFNHSTTSMHNLGVEIWDSDQGVATNNINHPPINGVNQTFSRQFNEPGTYFYGCRVHDTMRANVKVRGIPTASFTTWTTNPAMPTTTPFTGQALNFDASASFDDLGGTITKYEWDLDGDLATGPQGFELDTATVPTTSTSYPDAGARTVRLRVTDNDVPVARTDVETRTITVRSRVPTASFTVSPNPANEAAIVTFNGSASSDPGDDQIETWEWDLDGDMIFEVLPSGNPMTTTSYPAFGTRTARLKVTDTAGNFHITTRPVNVVNQPPVASFTATPNSVLTGETVSFDATASSDPAPGSVASYTWDLDGDNTFETNTGATPTTSRSYSSAGSITVRLRVTDDDGGTNITTRTVAVNAPPPQDPPPAESPPPVLPAPSIGGGSATVLPPALTLRGAAKQRALRQRGIIVTGGCDRACSLSARGSLNVPGGASRVFRLKPVTRRLTAAGSARIKLALPKAAQTAIRRALRTRKRVTATITAAATDASGSSTKTRRITLIG